MAGRQYGGVSAEERLAVRRAKLMEAGLELFGTRGVAKVTVEDLCEEAGLIKRYFYEQFSSLDEFVDALYEDLLGSMMARTLDIAETTSGIDVVRQQIHSLAEAFTADPRVARLLLIEIYAAGGSLERHRDRSWRNGIEVLMRDVPALQRGGFDIDDARVPMFAAAISGAFSVTLASWVEGGIDADLSAVAEFLMDFVVAAGSAAHASS